LSDYFLALSDHYKAVRARLNGKPTPRPVSIAPPPPPEPPAPEPAPPPPPRAPEFQFTPSAAKAIARAALVPHGMTLDQAMGPSRTLSYIAARTAVYVALRRHGWSLKKIAIFCNRDHTTVLNALNKWKNES
jgi:hypothetical protein